MSDIAASLPKKSFKLKSHKPLKWTETPIHHHVAPLEDVPDHSLVTNAVDTLHRFVETTEVIENLMWTKHGDSCVALDSELESKLVQFAQRHLKKMKAEKALAREERRKKK
eukprot:gnl/Dysnectes_brevis/997_a1112_2963.p1 GENE.gnl/Dysnectes_brevis/997_a1112_2963~~gnl/Dysnectes_brevis/997_a1112_2963.p1  ORF type:complete len:111 (-),score=23.22 gnl/Dysnectes_brevis/997_a1112_2963:179-511(-)